jgi:hypothetical protein
LPRAPRWAEQGLEVLGAAEQGVGDDEAVVGGPGVDAEAALAAATGDEGAVVDLEAEAEARSISSCHCRQTRAGDDEDVVDALAQEQLLEDEAGLDGLAEADVVGDEEVGARELEGLHQAG